MKIHIVKKGDTLYALSQKYGVSLQKLIETNPQISNPDALSIGEKVKIPASAAPVPDYGDIFYKHTVKQGDTLWKLAKAWGINLQEIISANLQLKNPNVLMVGEVVNIPKKGILPPAKPIALATAAVDNKMQPGAKTFTGPIEQPAKVIQPPVAPAPVKPTEVAPVQEKMHKETQSLYVQISVPTEEAVSYHEMPPTSKMQPTHEMAPTPKMQPAHEMAPTPNMQPEHGMMSAPNMQPEYGMMSSPNMQPTHVMPLAPCLCDPSAGYPGLTENPNFYDCPPAYPVYEHMPNMAMNMNAPIGMTPFFYPDNNMYPTGNFPGSWQHNPNNMYPLSPQSVGQIHNMPWPSSCGCGMGMQEHPGMPVQSYSNNAPMHNTLPIYTNQGGTNPYDTGMHNIHPQHVMPAVSPNVYGTAMYPNIPSMPEYPSMGNEQYGNKQRIAELQKMNISPDNLSGDTGTLESDYGEATEIRKDSEEKLSLPKVKTSGRSSKSNKTETSKTQHSSKNKGVSPTKKRRNPWISN